MQLLEVPGGWPSILLARAGAYDPDGDLAAAERAGAWSAWRRAGTALSPQAVVRIVSESGLRGRGGAGYPTGAKWRAAVEAPGDARYVVANGFEADPGAQVDRTLMESDPHAVVEGLALAAYAIGATRAFLVVKASYAAAARRLRAVVAAAEEAGYLGTDALGSGFDLHIEVKELAGGFVVGEETTLLRALESKRAQPEQRPPYPAVVGLWGKPTVVNNVETLATVPWIVANGGRAFASLGDAASPGTTLVQLSGAVARPGVAEVPTGTPIGRLLELAGGAAGRRALKALLVGGPTGGILPPDALDVPLAPGTLEEIGAILGSRTVLVADETACIVDLATLMTRFATDESCGKTIPCRIGLRRLYEIGDRFVTGRPRPTDGQLVADLAADIVDGGLCALERTAVNPLRSGMRYFEQEFEDHILRSLCPAGVCQPLRVAVGNA